MTVSILDTTDAIQALAPEWAALWRSTPAATPFQHPAWLLPWWSAFGTGLPRMAIARRDGELVGLIPAYRLDEPGGRKMLPMGAGTTDYLDALGQGIPPMLDALLARCASDGVPCLDWFDAPPGAAIVAADPGVWSDGNPCPVLTLSNIPAAIRRKQRMNQNRADRAGGWSVEDAGPAGFDSLVSLHQARWTAVAEPGVLADPAVLLCLRIALPLLHEAGLLRLQHLRVAGEVAATIMALLAPGRLFFYLSGYDAARAFISPGTILLGAMLDHAAAEGRQEAHFLRGRESYKYAWGATDCFNKASVITSTIRYGAGYTVGHYESS